MIREVHAKDARRIAGIYNYYIENTVITFETKAIDSIEQAIRIARIREEDYPFIVYEDNGEVIGYAYLSRWKEHEAYINSPEISIYIDKNYLGKGIGKVLYRELIDISRKKGYHVLIGIIACPNLPCQRLHEEMGFKKGLFKEVGYKFNKWVDVEYWQLIL
ncbi:MAG: N-acetyltransferase family protein [Candidatus Azobacteroides sp.]|nr:N-acetyltransferase family protein [Candidatus Azobacteroides sp.]